jgi:hypothetical protein
MSNPNTFINLYCAQINNFCNLLQDLRLMNDQLDADPAIVTDYFAQTSTDNFGGIPRKDIAEVDVTNAQNALIQMLFAFDSGSPTQKSYLFKVIP